MGRQVGEESTVWSDDTLSDHKVVPSAQTGSPKGAGVQQQELCTWKAHFPRRLWDSQKAWSRQRGSTSTSLPRRPTTVPILQGPTCSHLSKNTCATTQASKPTSRF